MRCDLQTKSLHYFNVYAVCDRIDSSQLAEIHQTPPKLQLSDFLPSSEDYVVLKTNLQVIISRILCQHMDVFKTNFSKNVIRHIPHKYSKEMSGKSHIVSGLCY